MIRYRVLLNYVPPRFICSDTEYLLTILARLLRPSLLAAAAVITTTALAPSLIELAFAAVMVPESSQQTITLFTTFRVRGTVRTVNEHHGRILNTVRTDCHLVLVVKQKFKYHECADMQKKKKNCSSYE